MRLLRSIAVTMLGAALVACGGTAAAPGAGAIPLTLTEFKYSDPTVELAADQTATLQLKNAGTVEHDLVIDAIGLKVSIQPGKTASRNIGPLKPGTYEIYCSVPGHKEAGMVGQLVVR